MRLANRSAFDTLRQLGFAGISGTYAAVGGPLLTPARAIEFSNLTAGVVYFAWTNGAAPASDGSADNILVGVGQSDQWNFASNTGNLTNNESFMFPVGTQFWVRQFSAVTSGLVGISCLIAVPTT